MPPSYTSSPVFASEAMKPWVVLVSGIEGQLLRQDAVHLAILLEPFLDA